MLTNPGNGARLPLREALRGVNAQHVRAGLNQGRDTLGIVAGIDACADNVTLVLVQQLQGVFLMRIVVLAEDHIDQVLIFIHQRQRVQLVQSQIILLASFRVVSAGAVISFSNGVINEDTFSSVDMREMR